MTYATLASAQQVELWREDEELYPSRMESWYLYWALGASGSPIYSGLYSDSVERLALDASRITVNFDALGIYVPLPDNHTLVGVVSNISVDRIYNVNRSIFGNTGSFTPATLITDIDFVQINQYQFSGSAIHFFGANVGDGLYLRGDLGIALIRPTVQLQDGSSLPNDIIDLDDQTTVGVLLGLGYGLPVSDDTRLMFNVNYSYRGNTALSSNIVTTSVGALF